MRFFFVWLIICCLSLKNIQLPAQRNVDTCLKKTLYITVKNKPLRIVLKELEQKANIVFSYSNNTLNDDSLVSFNKNASLEVILKNILPQKTDFIATENDIILFPRAIRQDSTITNLNSSPEKTKNQTPTINNFIQEVPTKISHKKNSVYFKDSIKWSKISNLKSPDFPIPQPEIPSQIITNITSPIHFKKNKWKVSFGLFYQKQIIDKIKWRLRSVPENYELVDAASQFYNLNSENYKISFVFQLTKGPWCFGTGLGRQEIKENYNYSPFFDHIVINAQKFYPTLYEDSNNYKYLGFPVIIGYKKRVLSKLKLGLSLTGWTSILTSVNGMYINIDTSVPDFIASYSPIDSKSHLNNLVNSLEFSFSVSYDILSRVNLEIAPSYITQINSDFSKNYMLHRTKKLFGNSFSINFIF